MNSYTTNNFKSGFVAFVGRPNVGKSSLLNSLIGQKITITSEKPQTTRNALRGILTTDNYQVVWIDTPGLHRPLHQLGDHMNRAARTVLFDVDIILWVLDARAGLTAADKKVAATLEGIDTPVFALWNKVDLIAPDGILPEMVKFEKQFRVSAQTGHGLPELLTEVVNCLPLGPAFYPPVN